MPIWLPQTTYSSIKALSVGRMMNSVHGLNPERTTSPKIPDNNHKGSKLTTAQPGRSKLIALLLLCVETPDLLSRP